LTEILTILTVDIVVFLKSPGEFRDIISKEDLSSRGVNTMEGLEELYRLSRRNVL
jgi:hypothetical protein